MSPFNGSEKNVGPKSSEERKLEIDEMLGVNKEGVSLSDKSHKIDTLTTVEKAHDEVTKLIQDVEEGLDEDISEQKEVETKVTQIKERCEALKERLENTDKTTVEAKLCYRFLHYLGRKENELKERLDEDVGPQNATTYNNSGERKSPKPAI
jgi:tRNA U34 5-carboxymethylaminomethyl modifying enzyme MnmG/GidA